MEQATLGIALLALIIAIIALVKAVGNRNRLRKAGIIRYIVNYAGSVEEIMNVARLSRRMNLLFKKLGYRFIDKHECEAKIEEYEQDKTE